MTSSNQSLRVQTVDYSIRRDLWYIILKVTNQEKTLNAPTNKGSYGRTTNADYTMPTVTRTITKGIPPRLRSPATKPGKSHKTVHKEKGLSVAKKRKATTDIDDELSDSGENPDSPRPKAKKRKRSTKRRREVTLSSDEEIEVVDNAAKPPQVIEVVDDVDNESGKSDMVSTNLQKI